MILAEMTWQEVEALSRDTIIVIPTGSLEQHGPFLPLFTDSLIATAVCESVEKETTDKILLTPCLWLGASGHHINFAGTCSATMTGYMESLKAVIESFVRHGFHRFLVINGHGGNDQPNGVALRTLKEQNQNLTLGHTLYARFGEHEIANQLEGKLKMIQHACEAEVSLMLHLYPNLVKLDKLRNDGLRSDPPTQSLVKMWDEISEEGSFGFATLATAEKGKAIFETCVGGIVQEIEAIHRGITFHGIF
jgi:creatinine amidohydrolase